MIEETKTKFNFVILCPEKNYGGFFSTMNSLQAHYPNSSCVSVVPKDTHEK